MPPPSRVGLFLSILASHVQAIAPPIHIKGARFFYENGTQFLLRGIYYSDSGKTKVGTGAFVDTLSADGFCSRDISYFQGLGINTLMVPDIDPLLDHSVCMSQLADAGIYVLIGLHGRRRRTSNQILGLDDVLDAVHFDFYNTVVETFHVYQNVLGFYFRRDYVVREPHLKAAIGSVKNFIQEKAYRKIPVGDLNAVFDLSTKDGFATYVNCGNRNQSADFLIVGRNMNLDDHCTTGASLFGDSLMESYSTYSIPAALIYGCKANKEHDYGEVQQIFGENATRVFSGGIVREYLSDASTGADLGLVDIDSSGSQVKVRPQYEAISRQFALLPSQSLLQEQSYTPTNTAPLTCRTATITEVSVSAGSSTTSVATIAPQIPFRPSKALCSCMMDTLSCLPDPSVNKTEQHEFFHEECDNPSTVGPKCDGVAKKIEQGVYGSYSNCNYTETAAWVINGKFLESGNDENLCKSMNGTVRAPVVGDKQSAVCKAFMRQVGTGATGVVTYTPTALSATDMTHKDTMLSVGAKAGIGVGVTIFLILVCLSIGACCLWSRRKKSTEGKEASIQIDEKVDTDVPELVGSKPTAEIDGIEKDVRELPANESAGAEADGTDMFVEIHEMDSETIEEKALRRKLERERTFNGTA